MNYKYVILDFGKVIAKPSSGDWDITPKFLELIDINKINKEKWKELRAKYGSILSEKVTNLAEEYNMFLRFYGSILSEFDISDKVIKEISYNRTYDLEKYTLYQNIKNELEQLKAKYKLILLTDNWPCVINFLKTYNLFGFFEKIYISSFYGVEKKDGELFDFPIKDFNIKPGEAIFIDDYELNLDIGKEKGLDVMLMDREKKVKISKYKIINELTDI